MLRSIRAISWKIHKISALKKMGVRMSLPAELFSRKYSRKTMDLYKNKALEIANSMGCLFDESIEGRELNDAFVFRVYDETGFVPVSGDIVADVGAHRGDNAVYWGKVCKAQVIAFEPLQDNFRVLQENLRLNQISAITYDVALGDGLEHKAAIVGNMLADPDAYHDDYETHTVKTITLDSYDLHRLDILKIDVEGYEVKVLAGAIATIRRCRPRVIVETHSIELEKEVHELLTQEGYELVRNDKSWIIPDSRFNRTRNMFFVPRGKVR